MTINVVNPFKSQAAKTFDKSKICSGKRTFIFGAITAFVDVDGNLSKAKPLEHVKSVQSSSLRNACAGIHAEKQKILSKIKLAKDRITKLFKPTGPGSAAVPRFDPFVTLSVKNCNTTDHSSTLAPPPVLQHTKSNALVVSVYGSIPPTRHSLKAITFPITYSENVADERIEVLASTSCSIVGASFLSSIRRPFTTPESPFSALSPTFLLSELRTIKEEDGSIGGAANMEQTKLAASASRISRSGSGSEVTVYLSSDTLSAHTTASEIGLVGSEISASPIATSFATSVDAGDNHPFLPSALRGLRRVPNYENLRNLQIIANPELSCSDVSCGSSDCDISDGAASNIRAALLRRSMKCDNLRKLFLSFEPKIHISPTRQMNEFRKLRAWLSTRSREYSHNTLSATASRVPNEPQKAKKGIPVPRSRWFLQGIIRPSSRVRSRVFMPSSCQSLPPSTPTVWSCAKITRSSSKAKRRRRMTKQSMKELKSRLDSMGIDPWY